MEGLCRRRNGHACCGVAKFVSAGFGSGSLSHDSNYYGYLDHRVVSVTMITTMIITTMAIFSTITVTISSTVTMSFTIRSMYESAGIAA